MSISARLRGVALTAACLLTVAACGTGTPARPNSASVDAPTGGAASGGHLIVLAAASLTESFSQIGKDVEADHPGSTVTFSFGSSATLATQVNQGAPADVLATASETTMKTVSDAGSNTAGPVTFVTNTLEIAVPRSNPANVTGLNDFADPSKKIALCAEQVPCGAAAREVFQLAGITPKPDTLESDVKATLQKVQLGEVDAALVYKTDVIAAGDQVRGIEFAEAAKVVNSYPIATLKASPSPELAQAFVDYVLSSEGQTVLTRAGFGPP